MNRTILTASFVGGSIFLAGAYRQPADPAAAPVKAIAPTFPESWIGRWKGDATVGVDGRMQRFTMELVVSATEKADRFGWTIIYDGAAGRQERKYALVVKDAAQGLYAIDEANGIVLDARMIGGTLYGHFLVQGNRITTRERLETDGEGARIDVEMVTTVDAKGTETGNAQGSPAVTTWAPVAVQKAVLRKHQP